MRRIILCSALLCAPMGAMAARPFITDDARVTTPGSCQLETWVRSYADSREQWFLPGCNPTGNLEITLGEGRAKYDGTKPSTDQVFQLKTLFKPLATNSWGWGLAAGTVRHTAAVPGPNGLGNTYAYLPVSFSFHGDRLLVHSNVGWLRDKATGLNSLTWGLGGELVTVARVSVIGESFGDNHSRPYWQTGARWAVIPDRVQFDATVGQRFSSNRSARWISLGLRITPDRLF